MSRLEHPSIEENRRREVSKRNKKTYSGGVDRVRMNQLWDLSWFNNIKNFLSVTGIFCLIVLFSPTNFINVPAKFLLILLSPMVLVCILFFVSIPLQFFLVLITVISKTFKRLNNK